MKNSIRLLSLTLRVRISQAIKVALATVKGEVSYYPASVRSVEKKFSKMVEQPYSIMFSNATSAIEAALFALRVGKNTRVATTAFVIPSSYVSAINLGAEVCFIDASDKTLNLDTNKLDENNSLGIDVLIVTHFYGNPCDMPMIMQWAKKNDVRVVEDCSHAHGAKIDGKSVGSWGDVGIFSLQGAKAVSAGEGGIALTSDASLVWEMAAYGHQESYKKFKFADVAMPNTIPSFGYGRKMRAHPLGAVLALVDLKYLNIKNNIYENWILELEKLALHSKSFTLPERLGNSDRGGYCQGVPIIFSTKLMATDFLNKLQGVGVNSFCRSYVESIENYQGSTKQNISSDLNCSYSLFERVVFVPFYQFIDFRRWNNMVNILQSVDD